MSTSSRPPLSDSPWFWLYVFGTAGIVALLWMSPKFGARQSQLDRQFEGRRHIMSQPADVAAARPFSNPERRAGSLRPLYWIMLAALVAGWIALWWQRYRVPASTAQSGPNALEASAITADAAASRAGPKPNETSSTTHSTVQTTE
jgi:cytoskeletal protein RodZ